MSTFDLIEASVKVTVKSSTSEVTNKNLVVGGNVVSFGTSQAVAFVVCLHFLHFFLSFIVSQSVSQKFRSISQYQVGNAIHFSVGSSASFCQEAIGTTRPCSRSVEHMNIGLSVEVSM